ncbi:excalibur calcium-binding domain-containing protein [Rathayibacter sp. AY1F9]|uniref:excalibur calcium-binding domain-containing protein n=1 Tax=Rathayibacter sp. AY1F9 TaxID=2080563 RepID=UPI0015E29094|nr:excalibur calcium-binding domain-containing protein [Rathayibacter sp. AY1F9]
MASACQAPLDHGFRRRRLQKGSPCHDLLIACLLAAGGSAALAPSALATQAVAETPTAFVPGETPPAEARGSQTYTNALLGGDSLDAGERIFSNGDSASFEMQADGNAVIYDAGRRPVWSTRTQGTGATTVRMQEDGNLVVVTGSGTPVWASGTAGETGALALIQDDGQLVLVRPNGDTAWSSADEQEPEPEPIADVLDSGRELSPGQQLTASDGRSRAAMQSDGNLVVSVDGSPRWSSVTSGAGNRLAMQTDGNAVVSAPGSGVRWQAGTPGNPGARMRMQNDGNLVITAASGRPLWASSTSRAPEIRDVLSSGSRLSRGQQLTSPDGRSRASLQGDGNLAVYSRGDVRWGAGTQGEGETLSMQSDGNAVVTSASGRPLWASGTAGNPGSRLQMQNDGNLVVYSASGRALWASDTPPASPAPAVRDTLSSGSRLTSGQLLRSSDGGSEAVMQGDGNLVVYSRGSARWAAGTSGGGNRLEMQSDGNAVVYAGSGGARWQSGTAGSPGSRMVMQNDGNLVIYSPQGRALWASTQAAAPAPAPAPGPGRPAYPGDAVNCDDFPDQASAQRYFDLYYPYYGDVAGLDRDDDGFACESN